MRMKRYKLRDGINSHDLAKLGFKDGSWLEENKNRLVMSKRIRLVGRIELNIIIPMEDEFDDFKDILVLDDEFCQPYTPFYGKNYGAEIEHFKFLETVIDHYNQAMGTLGIFEEKQ